MNMASLIRIRGLKKSFGKQIVLSHVDLDLPCANNLALLGISGSGKTVLMKCLSGLIAPDAGSIEIDGHNIFDISPSERSVMMRKIGVVFQNGALFDSLPVWQNVAFLLLNVDRVTAGKAREIAIEMLAKVGIRQRCCRFRPG
jgi:phospholipid/cholesterol/gamma-HCH transport system ATP-binding protein